MTFATHGESVEGLDTGTVTAPPGVEPDCRRGLRFGPGRDADEHAGQEGPSIMGPGIKSTIDKNPNPNPGAPGGGQDNHTHVIHHG